MKKWTAASCGLGLAMAALATPPTVRSQSATPTPLARGRVEIGTALSVSFTKESHGESTTVVNVPIRAGVMLTRRLEVELEALVTYVDFLSDGETGVIGAGHVLYHLGSGRTVPYLLAGAGYGNAVELLGIAGKTGNNLTVLRGGAGFKTFFGPHAAIRVEYRFTHYRGTDRSYVDLYPTYETLGLSSDIRINDHKALVGISLWL